MIAHILVKQGNELVHRIIEAKTDGQRGREYYNILLSEWFATLNYQSSRKVERVTEESGQRARQPNEQAVGVETKIRVGSIGHIIHVIRTRTTVAVWDPFTAGLPSAHCQQ